MPSVTELYQNELNRIEWGRKEAHAQLLAAINDPSTGENPILDVLVTHQRLIGELRNLSQSLVHTIDALQGELRFHKEFGPRH